MKRRVVVTGLGLVTPCGNDVPTTWDALMRGMAEADHILISHEHDDHIGGVAAFADPMSLVGRLRLNAGLMLKFQNQMYHHWRCRGLRAKMWLPAFSAIGCVI